LATVKDREIVEIIGHPDHSEIAAYYSGSSPSGSTTLTPGAGEGGMGIGIYKTGRQITSHAPDVHLSHARAAVRVRPLRDGALHGCGFPAGDIGSIIEDASHENDGGG
jgi:hypothetical protein